MKPRYMLLLILLSVWSGGCGVAASHQQTWVRQQGGLADADPSLTDRLDVARQHLGPAGQQIHVHALQSDTPGAYAWRDRHVYVTRGLVDLLTDQELAAALAHEIGHLLDNGHLHPIASLDGCRQTPDTEARADAVGAELLHDAGVPDAPVAMANMLQKLATSPNISPNCRSALERRIALLRGNRTLP